MWETIVTLDDFYSLNLWRILSGDLGWSSHTVRTTIMPFRKSALLLCLALHSVSSKGIPFETFGGAVLSWFLFQGYRSALV